MRCLFSRLAVGAALFCLSAQAQPAETFQPQIDNAFQHLYSQDFQVANNILDQYIAGHSSDPLGYAVKGSSYLFMELDRLEILESEFFSSDKKISDDKKKLTLDPKLRSAFYQTVEKAQALSQGILNQHPSDVNALFSMCLSLGNQVDYMALIDKRQIASLSVNKRAYRDAKHLIAVAPGFYDGYLTTGFTEYIVGSLPAIVRWLVKFDDVEGSKEQGVKILREVAQKGHYLKPFAKILLATAYLREKDFKRTQALLEDLTREYPSNTLLRRELAKVRVKNGAGG